MILSDMGEPSQKIRFSITYAHRRQRKIKHFHAAGRNFFGSSIESIRECAYNYATVLMLSEQTSEPCQDTRSHLCGGPHYTTCLHNHFLVC